MTVIIPAYNAAETIRQTLSSVSAQTYPVIEVIVVDDGSSDETSAIVEKFITQDPRIQLVRQSNAGVGAARNAGIRKARGEYIAPLDADDWWFPDKLQKQVERIDQCGDMTGLVYCGSLSIDEQGELVGKSKQTLEGHLRHIVVCRNIVGCASTPLFRATALDKVGLYLTRTEQGGAQGCEDWDLTMRIAENFSIAVVAEYLMLYRQTNSSMSRNVKHMETSFAVVLRRARQRNADVPLSAFRWSARNFSTYLVTQCYDSGRYLQCFRYLLKAVRADPTLLLNRWIYRTSAGALLNLLTGSAWRRRAKQGQRRNGTKVLASGSGATAQNRRPTGLNRLFRCFELTRWASALQHHT